MSTKLSRLDRFLGLGELPEQSQRLLKLFFYILFFIMLTTGMGQTFIILHYLETFGFKDGAVLLSITFLVQFLTDYPSGSLGDYIGQRIVLTIAMISFGIGYLIISQFESYSSFAVASIFFGFALGQMSGALETWLDNNYKATVNDTDPDNKIYGFATARIGTLANFVFGISFILGGIISTLISREFVFLLVAILIIFILPIIIIYVKDVPVSDQTSPVLKTSKSKNFLVYLKGGFKYLFSSKKSFTLLLGFAIIDAISFTWFTIFLFPIYFGYTGSDAGVGFLRSFLFITGGFLNIYAATLSKKVSNDKMAILFFIQIVGLFVGVIILLDIVPLNQTFNLTGVILLILLMTAVTPIFGAIAYTLRQRTLLETTPSEYRNSIYSLIPTIATVFQIPLMIYVGRIIENESLTAGLWIITFLSFAGIGLLFISQFFSETKLEKVKTPIPTI
ncbi:MAG: MFS transporter [Candidatus Kariarchaeaceae archaeon]